VEAGSVVGDSTGVSQVGGHVCFFYWHNLLWALSGAQQQLGYANWQMKYANTQMKQLLIRLAGVWSP